MKKIIYALSPLLMLFVVAFVGINSVSANTVDDPLVIDLLASKTNDIGDVIVWNDEDTLYVKFLIVKLGWEMTESHLYVGDLDGLPVGKGGNPKVGKFPYSDDYSPPTREDLYIIPLAEIEIDDVDDMVIAAHAAVQKVRTVVADPITPTITWTRSAETEEMVLDTPGYGGTWDYDDVIDDFTDMSATAWDNGLYNPSQPVIPGLDYASWQYKFTNPDGGNFAQNSDLRLFRAQFEIPSSFMITGATLGVTGYTDRIPINDNVYIYANEELVFWGGTRANAIGTHEGMPGIQAIGYPSSVQRESDGWYIPGTFPSITNLIYGTNIIEVFTEENEGWGGMGQLTLTLNGRLRTDEVIKKASAWAEGIKINHKKKGGSWATYFEYDWTTWNNECVFVETVTIPSNGTIVNSSALTNGDDYHLEASGTYRFVGWGDQGIADTKYSYRIPAWVPPGYPLGAQWVDGADLGFFNPAWAYYLQVWIDGAPSSWVGDYNDGHIYTRELVGDGTGLAFNIMDNAYGDNSGSLEVDICKYEAGSEPDA